jgi:hypothetical protein
MYIRPMFRKQKGFIPSKVASTTAEYHSKIASSDLSFDGNAFGANFDCTIEAISGSVTMTYSTAVTSTEGFALSEGTICDVKVENEIYLCSNSTAARYQAIIWESK